MWHASVRLLMASWYRARRAAMGVLHGVGDASLGEWRERSTAAQILHLRRRLSALEQAGVGEAVDVRGTPEVGRRVALMDVADPTTRRIIEEEIG